MWRESCNNYIVQTAEHLELDINMATSHPTQPSIDDKKALFEALAHGNVQVAKEILQTRPELVNCELTKGGFFGPPLLCVCQYTYRYRSYEGESDDNSGLYDFIHFLLEHGADPDGEGYRPTSSKESLEFGRVKFSSVTLLMDSALSGATSLVKLLLNAGANVNKTNSVGQTTLHVCCSGMIDRNDIIELLLHHGADVNGQDPHGRTALHCACENQEVQAVKLLLKAGAEFDNPDNSGFTGIELAAQSFRDPLLKVQSFLDSYEYPTEKIIEAYETATWSLLQRRQGAELGAVIDYMRKATLMRTEHNMPKIVCEPLECYGFAKEWETMEDLSRYENSVEQISLQAMLSRERIHRGRHRLGPLLEYVLFYESLRMTETQLNAGLMHHLDLYEESLAMPGLEGYQLLTGFNRFPSEWFCRLLRGHGVSTDSISKTVTAVTDNCQKMKTMLEKETEVLDHKEMVGHLNDSVLVSTGPIIKLHKRNISIPGIHETEGYLAKHLLKEVVNKIGEVVSRPINFKRPVQHIICEAHLLTVM